MNDEVVFRFSLASIAIALTIVRLHYARLAGRFNQKTLLRREDQLSTPVLWLVGVVAAVTSALYVVAPGLMRWAAVPVPLWLRLAGIAVGGLTVVFFWWAHQALGVNWAMPAVIKEQQTLISHGPYRWVRHPMYTTIFVWAPAFFLLSANWFIGLAWMCLGGLFVHFAGAG